MGDITTDPICIKITIRKYKQIYVHKFYNLHEVDQFLESYKLLKLTKENLNVPISIFKIKFSVQIIQKQTNARKMLTNI